MEPTDSGTAIIKLQQGVPPIRKTAVHFTRRQRRRLQIQIQIDNALTNKGPGT